MSNFGNVNIQIPDGSAPSAPSSGATIYSVSGDLRAVNVSNDSAILAAPPTAGNILIADGTKFTALAAGSDGQILTSNGTTAVWATPSYPTVGITSFSGATATITDPSITTSTIVVATGFDSGGGGNPIRVTSISAGSFTLGSTTALDQVMYFYM